MIWERAPITFLTYRNCQPVLLFKFVWQRLRVNDLVQNRATPSLLITEQAAFQKIECMLVECWSYRPVFDRSKQFELGGPFLVGLDPEHNPLMVLRVVFPHAFGSVVSCHAQKPIGLHEFIRGFDEGVRPRTHVLD